MLRGGAGGSQATKRKRAANAAQQQVLGKLCAVLAPFLETLVTSPGAKAAPKKRPKKKNVPVPSQSDHTALSHVERLSVVVEETRKDPESLVKNLKAFCLRSRLLALQKFNHPPNMLPNRLLLLGLALLSRPQFLSR